MSVIYQFDEILLNKIAKCKKQVILRIILFSLIYVLITTILIVFQNRTIANLIIFILSLLTTLYICYLVIEIKEILEPLKNYKKEIEYALLYQTKKIALVFISKDDNLRTYLGIKCHQYNFQNENKKEIKLFTQSDYPLNLSINKKYNVQISHNFISYIED